MAGGAGKTPDLSAFQKVAPGLATTNPQAQPVPGMFGNSTPQAGALPPWMQGVQLGNQIIQSGQRPMMQPPMHPMMQSGPAPTMGSLIGNSNTPQQMTPQMINQLLARGLMGNGRQY